MRAVGDDEEESLPVKYLQQRYTLFDSVFYVGINPGLGIASKGTGILHSRFSLSPGEVLSKISDRCVPLGDLNSDSI